MGLLCADCRADLLPPTMAPEQITERVATPTDTALVDYWGRAHLLDAAVSIGRDLGDDSGVAIHESSVSRLHAKLSLDQGVWSVADLGSSNGTFVEDVKVEGPVALSSTDKIKFGSVAFYFLERVDTVSHDGVIDSETVRPGAITQPIRLAAAAPRICDVKLHEPTGGGGGIVQIDGKSVQLSVAQLELIRVLLSRMELEADKPDEVRGFVSVSELIGKLSLDAALPRDAHVRQLIRRVRRAFIKAQLGDVIESRYGLGYRILVIRAQGT